MINCNDAQQSEQARKQLVYHLRQSGVLHSERIAQAFSSIPRELFVTTFLEQEGFAWKTSTPAAYTQAEWIAQVYRDEPLVIWIDTQNRAGSSSSAPTVMAMMLESLELQPGMRVLEIGTGTGYNAALLASLVDNPDLVTSIDIEPVLAQTALRSLETVVGPVTVEVGDGYGGVPQRAPYDRIIVTASSGRIPRAWYEQLAPGGRLVMDLQGSLRKSGFLVIEKKRDGSASGIFQPHYLHFMPMRSGPYAAKPTRRLLQQAATQYIVQPDDEVAATLFSEFTFHWFLQWALPGLTLTKARLKASDDGPGSAFITLVDGLQKTIVQIYLRNDEWSGYERGQGGLWSAVLHAYQEWQEAGRPAQSAYSVQWDQQREKFCLLCDCAQPRQFDL